MAKATTTAAAERDMTTIKVRATSLGYIYHKRRYEHDVFTLTPFEGQRYNDKGKLESVWITAQDQFSERWMEVVDARTPEKETSGIANLRKQHEEIRASKNPMGMQADEPASHANVLG